MWSSCSRGTVTGVGSRLMPVRPLRLVMVVILVILVLVVRAAPAHAQQQSVTFALGHFAVRGEDARISDDVLVENLDLFAFKLGDFNNASAGAEWLIGLGEYVEAGVGLGFYRRTVASTYDDFVDVDGSEIEQDLKLRVIPFTTTIRFFPFGRSAAVQPYVGGGLGIYAWRYSEVGDFIDFSNFDIFREQFVAEGNDVGTVVLGGVRMPFGSRFAVGGELRYQTVQGTVGVENGFLEERIDLGGLTAQATFQVKF